MTKPFIIYAYRMTSDTGGAPCIHDLDYKPTGILTLACCKGGQIRDEKGIGTGLRHTIGKRHQKDIDNDLLNVYIMGIYKNSLLYFAKITKILTMEDYYSPDSQYKYRLDSIYHFAHGKFKRNGNNAGFHSKNDPLQHRRDWLGKYVLVSTCFAYWGKNSEILPKEMLEFLPKYQESKSYRDASHEGDLIKSVIEQRWNFVDIIPNDPHMPGKTYHGKGCGVRCE